MIDVKDLENRIINSDCMDILKQLPDKCIDCILTDPPYFGIVKNDWDNQWKNIQDFQAWVGEVGKELYRVLKDNGSFYWFGSEKNIAYSQVILDKYFFLLNNITWEKPNGLGKKGVNLNNRSFGCITENILFYEKENTFGKYLESEINKSRHNYCEISKMFPSKTGGKTGCVSNWVKGTASISEKQYKKIQQFFGGKFCSKEYQNLAIVWNKDKRAVNILKDKKCFPNFHPTQKPLSLISYLIERSTNPYMLVLDCFSGSGTTAIACHRLKRRFICIEKDPEYAKASIKRLEDEQRQGTLF